MSVILNCQSVSEQRLEGFAKAKTATPFIASEQERQDNRLNIGVTCHVILNLFQDLIKKGSRNKCGMTLVSSHCEAVAIARSLELNEITTSCATPRNDMCHRDVLAEGSQETQPRPRISKFAKLTKKFNPRPQGVGVHPVSEAHSKTKKFNPRPQGVGVHPVSEAHSKHLFPYSPINLFTFKKAAFTLAEVLITLGIIGVVAAMTIPTLIANYQEKVTITRLKEAYSMLSQAYQFAVNENGSPVAMANYFKPYLRLSADCVGKSPEYVKEHCASTSPLTSETVAAFLRLNNGATLIFRVWDPSCNGVYANSIKGDTCGHINVLTDPMKTLENGRNQFMFYLTTKGIIPAGMDGSYLEFERACNPDIELPYPGFASDSNMYACAAWVIYNNNMDYLKCPGELSWDGKHSCKD